MLQISAELLAMSSDAAVLIKNGRLAFANAEAYTLLGPDCIGKSVKKVFGDDIAGIQAGSFIGEFPLRSKQYIIRACSAEGIKAFFLSDTEPKESLISDAFIFSLRNCLMSMDVTLSLLRDNAEQSPQTRERLAVVSHESCRINRIMNNVSIIQAARNGEIPFSPTALELSSFIEQILDSVRLFIKTPELRLNSPGEINIYADPGLLECLMLNLISNCIIHAEGCSRISISLSPGKERCFISIDDDGCGIVPEHLHGVFDRYTHRYELNQMGKGPGLGLSTARSIATLHGGTLLLESRPEIGTAVRVSLARNPYVKAQLKQPVPIYERNAKSLISGLANCLNWESFTELHLD